MTTPRLPRYQCVATKPRLDGGTKRCPKHATHGEWCRMHAQSLGGWVLVPPDPNGYRELASSFWVAYRCGWVDCRIVEQHEHGGGQPMREMTPTERTTAALRAASREPQP